MPTNADFCPGVQTSNASQGKLPGARRCLDFRDYLASYSEYARGAAEDNSELQNFFTMNFGASFYLPTSVYISR